MFDFISKFYILIDYGLNRLYLHTFPLTSVISRFVHLVLFNGQQYTANLWFQNSFYKLLSEASNNMITAEVYPEEALDCVLSGLYYKMSATCISQTFQLKSNERKMRGGSVLLTLLRCVSGEKSLCLS